MTEISANCQLMYQIAAKFTTKSSKTRPLSIAWSAKKRRMASTSEVARCKRSPVCILS